MFRCSRKKIKIKKKKKEKSNDIFIWNRETPDRFFSTIKARISRKPKAFFPNQTPPLLLVFPLFYYYYFFILFTGRRAGVRALNQRPSRTRQLQYSNEIQ